jgi:hypothetical protein
VNAVCDLGAEQTHRGEHGVTEKAFYGTQKSAQYLGTVLGPALCPF